MKRIDKVLDGGGKDKVADEFRGLPSMREDLVDKGRGAWTERQETTWVERETRVKIFILG